jgi:hypothetical protein
MVHGRHDDAVFQGHGADGDGAEQPRIFHNDLLLQNAA